MLLSDKNKILNDEQRRQRNNPQIKIDNAENSLFPKKMKCMILLRISRLKPSGSPRTFFYTLQLLKRMTIKC